MKRYQFMDKKTITRQKNGNSKMNFADRFEKWNRCGDM